MTWDREQEGFYKAQMKLNMLQAMDTVESITIPKASSDGYAGVEYSKEFN